MTFAGRMRSRVASIDRVTWVIVGDRTKVRKEIEALGWTTVENLERA